MDIGEVARQSGLAVSTLRYYEERGLITSTGRRGLRRQFDNRVVERLALISLGQAGGFSLNEIKEMLGANGAPAVDRSRLLAKADEIDLTIGRLAAVRDNLRHTALCSAPDHMSCPSFKRLLAAAVAQRVAAAGPTPTSPSSPGLS